MLRDFSCSYLSFHKKGNYEKRIISFSPPDITEAKIQKVANAMRSGWITTGSRTKKLEKEIASWIGVNKCVCLNSATTALELVFHVLGIGPSDEVITCAYTYTASASPVCHVGAKLVLVDCKKNSFLIDYNAVEAAIIERTKVIIPIDLGGIPCDYDRLFQIVESKKALFHASNKIQESIGRIAIIDDAAHAFGSVWHGKMVGSIANFTSFSFIAYLLIPRFKSLQCEETKTDFLVA